MNTYREALTLPESAQAAAFAHLSDYRHPLRIRVQTPPKAQNPASARKPMRGFALPTDGQGFEPWVRYERTHAFQACALNHSAIHPENYIFYCSSVYLTTSCYTNAPARGSTTARPFPVPASRLATHAAHAAADRVRFELTIPLPVRRFSRPVPSTTQPPVQHGMITNLLSDLRHISDRVDDTDLIP